MATTVRAAPVAHRPAALVRPRSRLAAAAVRPRLAVRASAAEATQQNQSERSCPPRPRRRRRRRRLPAALHCSCRFMSLPANHPHRAAFLEELRDYSMKLHTKSQAPKEGKAPEKREQKPVGAGLGC